MKKIVVAQELDLYPGQKERLRQLGETTFYDTLSKSYDEWIDRVKDADIICSEYICYNSLLIP